MIYFISFTFERSSGAHGEGNGSVERTSPITCIADIRGIEKALVDDIELPFEWVNITTWRRFE